MINEYEKWLKSRNFTAGTIRISLKCAKRILSVYPEGKLPEDIYKVSEHFQINTARCTRSRCNLRSNIRRFAEFLGHEFK